jgi:hypothetical protein
MVEKSQAQLAARIRAGKAALDRLATTAMNPSTRAAIACMAADLNRAAKSLQHQDDLGALADLDASLDLLEHRVRSIEEGLRAFGSGARLG